MRSWLRMTESKKRLWIASPLLLNSMQAVLVKPVFLGI